MRTRSMLFAAAAAAVVAAAGCSGAPGGPDAESASPPAAEATAGNPPDGFLGQVEPAFAGYAHCMIDRGWALERDGDSWSSGWSVPPVPDEQWDTYQADDADCTVESGVADLPPPSVTTEEAGALYDLLQDVAGCVRDLGYHVPDPPSREAFVEALVERPIPTWHPHYASAAGGLAHVEAACPAPEWSEVQRLAGGSG